jgi:hypothetical protein
MRALVAILLVACKPQVAGPELEAVDAPADANALIDAGRAKVQSGDPDAPILLKRTWRWRPAGQELVIWTLCQGEMDAQGCVLFVGKSGALLEVLAEAPMGWEPPQVRAGSSGLVIEGEDGRSSFTRTLRLEDGRPVIGPDQRPEGS